MEEDQNMILCPYNAAHVILKHRMAAHLIKCRKQYPTKEFSICPFNSTHDVPTRELKYHTETCKDRRKMDSYIYISDEPDPKIKESLAIELPPSNENWDEDLFDTGSYLDVKNEKLQNQCIFQVPVGMSKAERKKFSIQQVEKFANLNN